MPKSKPPRTNIVEKVILIARTDFGSEEYRRQAISSTLLTYIKELCGDAEEEYKRGDMVGDESAEARNQLRQEILKQAKEELG